VKLRKFGESAGAAEDQRSRRGGAPHEQESLKILRRDAQAQPRVGKFFGHAVAGSLGGDRSQTFDVFLHEPVDGFVVQRIEKTKTPAGFGQPVG
jgi:hypothetical protein